MAAEEHSSEASPQTAKPASVAVESENSAASPSIRIPQAAIGAPSVRRSASEAVTGADPAGGGTRETGAPPCAPTQPLLAIEGLSVRFGAGAGVLRRVGFEVRRGEILALVGESGCGKTLTALAILGLLPPAATVIGGRIELDGDGDLLALDRQRRREVRGRRLAMIFQEPMSAMNPVLSLGFQIGEVLRVRQRLSRRQSLRQAGRLLELVGMPDPERRLQSFPHQLSGGQLQRSMIAMALASEPDLLLADEPTTALDVTVQAQVIDLLLDLRRRLDLTVLLITHDLGVVAQCCDRVVVMYAGEVVEQAAVGELFARSAHPYTRALLASVPRLDGGKASFEGIPGRVPEAGQLPSGCPFHPRCGLATEVCRRRRPALNDVAGTAAERHAARCFLLSDVASAHLRGEAP